MKTLTLDLGNSTLFAGIFRGERLLRTVRIAVGRTSRTPPTKTPPCKAGFGLSAIALATAEDPALQLKRLARGKVDRVVLCSVVPKQTARLVALVKKTFGLAPLVLTTTSDHGLKLDYRRPAELGPDRLANVLGARKLYPGENIIVVDCGTATTLTLLRREGCLLGGAIMPGLGLWGEALVQCTARLPEVSLRKPREVVGRDTKAALRSGILHGHTGAIRELVKLNRAEAFGRSPVVVLGTGGLVTHFKSQSLFTAAEPALILHGLQAFAARTFHHA